MDSEMATTDDVKSNASVLFGSNNCRISPKDPGELSFF